MLVSLVGMAGSGADEGYGGGTAGFDVRLRNPGRRDAAPRPAPVGSAYVKIPAFSPPYRDTGNLVCFSVIQLFYPSIRGSSVQTRRNERQMNEFNAVREKRTYAAQAARKHRVKVRMEAELLKKDNERLKRENDALRRENESYKRELLSLQGTLLGRGVSKVQNAEGNAHTVLTDAYRQVDGHHGSPEISELGAPRPYLMSKESGTLDDAPIPEIVSNNLFDGDLVTSIWNQ